MGPLSNSHDKVGIPGIAMFLSVGPADLSPSLMSCWLIARASSTEEAVCVPPTSHLVRNYSCAVGDLFHLGQKARREPFCMSYISL